MSEPRWIDLDGASNVRDLAGAPAHDGRRVRPGRLLRSDSLQTLSAGDVRHLVDELRVRSVVDLRTGTEVRSEGPGPLTREPLVDVAHLSLFPEPADDDPVTDASDAGAGPVVLPWQERTEAMSEPERRRGATGIYLRYLADRPDSVLAALRLVARTGRDGGATIVHCAAGKDRTGVLVALALTEVGVPREVVVADYACTAERIGSVVRRLAARRTYAGDLDVDDLDRHTPRPETMEQVLDAIDAELGGVRGWLRASGWRDEDAEALRAALLD